MFYFNLKGVQTIRSEQDCESLFLSGGPFWHLCTPGQSTELLFQDEKDYITCVRLIALVQRKTGVRILTFAVMSNHLHFILECEKAMALAFFEMLKKKLRQYFATINRYVNLREFNASVLGIDNLRSLRNEIVYVNRNGYLANSAYTPFSYPWGAGCFYYNLSVPGGIAFSTLSRRDQEAFFHGRTDNAYGSLVVDGDMVLPYSFCEIERGMSFFKSGHQYFSLVSKNYEAFSEIANRLGDTICLSDDEMFSTVMLISKKQYQGERPSMLPIKQKMELAKTMRYDYNASEGQIQRMLRLDRKVVSELFGR